MMDRTASLLGLLLLAATSASSAQQPAGPTAPGAEAAEADYRRLVEMPAKAKQLMREDMLGHLAALNEILGLLSTGDLDKAAEVAERKMGQSAIGRHRGSGAAPGRFMPPEMREMGWDLHRSASEFAEAAQGGDRDRALAKLQQVMTSCVLCHSVFRTR